MAERKDYSGDFDPDFRFEDLSKEALVRLVREFALIAQLLDRSVFAAVALRYGPQAVEELAIEEWRGASPIYTERIRKIMNIQGDGVPAIFKQLQLDPGFAQHYMDVEYEVVDDPVDEEATRLDLVDGLVGQEEATPLRRVLGLVQVVLDERDEVGRDAYEPRRDLECVRAQLGCRHHLVHHAEIEGLARGQLLVKRGEWLTILHSQWWCYMLSGYTGSGASS